MKTDRLSLNKYLLQIAKKRIYVIFYETKY